MKLDNSRTAFFSAGSLELTVKPGAYSKSSSPAMPSTFALWFSDFWRCRSAFRRLSSKIIASSSLALSTHRIKVFLWYCFTSSIVVPSKIIFEPTTLVLPGLCIRENVGGASQVRAKISDHSPDGCLFRRKGTVYNADPGVPSMVGSVTSSTMTPTIPIGSLLVVSSFCGSDFVCEVFRKRGAIGLSPRNVVIKSG